jgi:co-chaperonin GroES (HSP10)
MAVSLDAYLLAVSNAENPKAEIKKWAGNLKDINLTNDRILVATFARPQKTAGGVYLADSQLAENRWQGMVGLYLAGGPSAFEFDGPYKYNGEPPKIGSWLVYKPADSTEVAWRKMSCRIMRSESVIATISDPLLVF